VPAFFFLLRALVATLVVAAVMVGTQDIQMFPSISFWNISSAAIPKDVEVKMLLTPDGKRIETWIVRPPEQQRRGTVVLLNHGNAETNRGVYSIQKALSAHGVTSYSYDYRGTGGSSGWPSEKGIYLDAETVWNHMLESEGISASDAVIWGSSMGSGPAAYLAAKFNPSAIVFLSPYTSIPDLVRGMFLYRYLAGFLWWNFPVKDYVSKLTTTCLVIAHGKKDDIIPYQHGLDIKEAYRGSGKLFFINSDESGHNDLISRTFSKIVDVLSQCQKASD
jgi:fermentation-respiration switch protein FrsA (DUF1100 family)